MDVAEQIQPRLESAIGQRYEILGPIGRGGMASVYLARHRVHGGFCAVKVLAEQLAKQPPLVRSFLAEARASASLDEHPNIVNIVDIDEHAGLYYMIMKYVEGEDLSTYLKRKRVLPWKQAAYIAAEVAEALSWSHDRGVIHRDLKPSNIRLSRRGGITVMDFGIAKVGQTPSSFTEMGTRAGTPHYMAPEQIRGDAIDHRSDLYGLGVILYQMVTGERPFDGASPALVWQAHISDEPRPPQEIQPAIPDPLNHIILTLLAKEPDKRYDSAARLVRHLRTLGLDGVAQSLDPVDTLNLDQLRTQEIRARVIEPTPVSITETGPSAPSPPAQPAEAPLDKTAEIPSPAPLPPPAPRKTPVSPAPAAAVEQTRPVPQAKSAAVPTLPPAHRTTPRVPDTASFDSSQGARRPTWIVATALVVALGFGAAWYRSSRSVNPSAAIQPAAPAEPQTPVEEAPPAEQTPAPAATVPPPAPAAATPPRPAAPATTKAAAAKTGALYFRTDPPGATVQVDNRPDWSCETPCWLETLSPGQHNVTVRLEGYRVAIQRATVAAGAREQLEIKLEADLIPVMIASTPPGAEIYIDGVKQAEKTNARVGLKQGTYQIRVVLPGVAEGEQALVVSENQMPFANFVLEAK